MPTGGQWAKFLGGCTLVIGSGVIFVNYFVPSDDKFMQELSPQIKAQVLRDRELRHRADLIMQKKIEETQDKPAWLQGSDTMRKLEREVLDQARREIEQRDQAQALAEEKERFAELAAREFGKKK